MSIVIGIFFANNISKNQNLRSLKSALRSTLTLLSFPARERRIAKQKEREEKERLLAEALAANKSANEKISEIQQVSDAKYSELKN